MKPIEFVGQTHLFGPPRGWDQRRDGACGSLPVKAERIEHVVYLTSFWKPSQAELDMVAAGAHVKLSLIGTQVPVCVSVEQAEALP